MIFHPIAQEEIRAVTDFYKIRDADVALRYAAQLAECSKKIQEHPHAYPVFIGQIRKMPMPHFPFNILYSVVDSEPYIIAIMHQRRKPDYWKNRI